MLLDVLMLSFLVAGVRGGRPSQLQLNRPSFIFLAVALQVGAIFVPQRVSQALILISYAVLVAALAGNFGRISMRLMLVGVLLNVVVIACNYGRMPVSLPEAEKVGVSVAPLINGTDFKRIAMSEQTRFNFLGDVIYLPVPLRRVVSIGDLVVGLGAFMLVQEFMSKPVAFRVRRLGL